MKFKEEKLHVYNYSLHNNVENILNKKLKEIEDIIYICIQNIIYYSIFINQKYYIFLYLYILFIITKHNQTKQFIFWLTKGQLSIRFLMTYQTDISVKIFDIKRTYRTL